MSVKNLLTEIASNPKIAVGVAGTTTTTGVSTILELIPDGIGKLATVVGICLSLVLIYTHVRRGLIEFKKGRLEIELLKRRLADQDD